MQTDMRTNTLTRATNVSQFSCCVQCVLTTPISDSNSPLKATFISWSQRGIQYVWMPIGSQDEGKHTGASMDGKHILASLRRNSLILILPPF